MSLANHIKARPTRTSAEAHERFRELAARDGASISVAGRSRLFATGERARRAVVFIHGFTNCPEQWVPFAQEVAGDGFAVVIPRLPGHGHLDHKTRSIGRVRTAQLLAIVNDAIDIATGLAPEVVVCGLSIGGSIAVRQALARSDVATAVAIVPFFGLKGLGEGANSVVARTLETVPNFFMPWDPSGKNATVPPYGYSHFPTRVLGECLGIGVRCVRQARAHAPHGDVRFLLNANEPACNNDLAFEVARRFERDGARPRTIVLDLPANHDIIDRTNPFERTAIVYPRVRELLEA